MVQQIIKNETTMDGVHYNSNIEFLDANLQNDYVQLEKILNGTHINLIQFVLLCDSSFTDYEDYKIYLLSMVYKRIRLHLTNIINLSFSEN